MLVGALACSAAPGPKAGSGSGGAQGGTGGVGSGGSNAGSGGSGSGGTKVGPAGTGGASGSGGVGSGGSSPGSGGAASGGAAATGGRTGSGGAAATGGLTGSGGVAATGGRSASGGGTGSGGVAATGGRTGSGGGSAATGGSTGDGPEPFVSGVPPTAAAHFKKGINLGNRLEAPNEGDWGGTVLASDFPFIARRGFDHVRIPIRFSGHAAAAAPYTIDATFFARIDTVLDQATAANLAVVVDMHAYDELASDVSGNRDRFVGLWTQIAARYKDRPDTIAFELLNEPNTQLDTTWNDVMVPAIQAIRATNPRRLLIVDAVFWADPTKLATLTLPNDANIMASIHLYEPKLFTFQGMSWMGPAYLTTGVIFPGPPSTPVDPVQAAKDTSWANQWFMDYNTKPADTNPSGPATITSQVALMTAYAHAQGRTVYNGEWGPQDGGPLDSRVRLVTAVRQQCESAGFGWAIWEDPVNMNLFDSSAGTWVTAIIDALLPP